MKRVLFVCSGNTCRSPMAQGLFARILTQKGSGLHQEYEALSAGLFAGEDMPAAKEAVETMQQYKIDLSGHRSRRIDQNMIKQADLILVMTTEHYIYMKGIFSESAEKIFLLGSYAGCQDQDVIDPYGRGIEAYKESADQIKQMLEKIVEKLC